MFESVTSSEPEGRPLARLLVGAFSGIGCISLVVAALAFLSWGSMGSSQPGESWEVWNARIDSTWKVINTAVYVAGGAALVGLVVALISRQGRVVALLSLLAVALFVLGTLWAVLSAGIR